MRTRRQPFFLTPGVLAASLAVLSPITAQAAVTISGAATRDMVCTSGVCSPNHKNAVLNITDLQNLLATSSVTVTTGTGSAQALDIIVNGAVAWSSGSTLKLDAYDSVTINKSISVTGTGGVSLVTNDGGTGGALSFAPKGNINFSNLASSLTINGAAFTLVGDIATLASDIAANASGDYALAANYNAAPDGTYPASPITTTFNGDFEGLGNTISNLAIEDESNAVSNIGLFAELGPSAEIRYLGLIELSVQAHAHATIGGLVGENDGLLYGDYSTGKVSAGQGSTIGGLVGCNLGTIEAVHSAAAVHAGTGSSSPGTVGGLVGCNEGGSIDSSYSTGTVTLARSGAAGALVGVNYAASVSNSYATGSVREQNTNSNVQVGGLVGVNVYGSNTSGVTISDSYAKGALSAPVGSSIGGLVGQDGTFPGAIVDTYWDTTTSGVSNLSQGAGNMPNDPGITGLTTAQLQSALPAGFDSSVWGLNPAINGGLPYLLANPPR